MTKRFLSLVLAVLMAFSLCSPALALTEPVEPDQAAPISEPEAQDLPAPAAAVTKLTLESSDLEAGKEGGKIKIKADGGNFYESYAEEQFSLSTECGTLLVSNMVREEDPTTATLTVTGTPNKGGNVTLTAQTSAFEEGSSGKEAVTLTNIPVAYAAGNITAALEGGTLTAGQDAGSTKIKLTITQSTKGKLEFNNSDLGKGFTLSGDGLDNVEVTDASGDEGGTTATLTLFGTPAKGGNIDVTVSVPQAAFKYQPDGAVTANSQISVSYPAPGTVSAAFDGEGQKLTAGVQATAVKVKLTSTALVFADAPQQGSFTLDPGTDLTVGADVIKNDDHNVTLTLSGTPKATGDITINIAQAAFKYQPQEAVKATGITVSAPTGGSVKATCNDTLTAGASAGGKTIELNVTGDGYVFNTDVATKISEYFAIGSDDGVTGLSITSAAKDGDTKVTLTLGGTPDKNGTVKVTVKTAAFQYTPEKDITSDTISIGYPTIKPTAQSIIAGKDKTVTVTSDGVPFNTFSDNAQQYFKISDGDLEIIDADSSGDTTATLTLNKAPTTTDKLNITVEPDAFKYKPQTGVQVEVTVTAPSGAIEAKLGNGKLTAGVAASDKTITVKVNDGDLIFKDQGQLAKENFTLGGVTGLNISNVKNDAGTVTLTLSGTPDQAGDITVKAEKTAFVAAPAEDAATVTLTGAVDYATVTMKVTSGTLPDAGGTVTLTASGSDFKSGDIKQYFELGDHLTIVSVTGSGSTATMEIKGPAHLGGDVTITAQPGAFLYQPEDNVTATLDVQVPSVKLTPDPAEITLDGKDKTFTLTASGSKFHAASDATYFSVEGCGSPEITAVTAGEGAESAQVTVTGITEIGNGKLTITVEKEAFTDTEPSGAVKAIITVKAPTVTLTASPASITRGQTPEITLTAEGGVFNAITDAAYFKISGETGAAIDTVTAAEGENTAKLTLSAAPTTSGTMTITVEPGAFKYPPAAAVTASITVSEPYSPPAATPTPTPTPTATPEPTTSPEPTASPEPTPSGELVEKDGKTYCVDEDGEFLTGKQTVDGTDYYFSEKDGHKMTSGVVNAGGGTLYYLSAKDGHIMKGGWINAGDGKHYYAQADGSLKCGKFTAPNGKDYYTNSKGLRQTGKQTISGKDYYFSVKDGHMMKGGLVTGPGGKQYYVSAKDGHMMKGGWARGQAVTGKPGYSWYYDLDKTGVVIRTVQHPTNSWPA